MKIKDLKEFIIRHELDDDTEISSSHDSHVMDKLELLVVVKHNGEKIKPILLISSNH